jgi:ankyrin
MSIKNISESPLFFATEQGNLAGVRSALRRDIASLYIRYQGETPLHIASRKGYTDIVRLLLQTNLNIDHQNRAGCTALALACVYGHADIVRLLLEHGAHPNSRNSAQYTPLMMAAQNGHIECVTRILSTTDGKLSINFTDEDNCTALFMACLQNHWNIVRILIRYDADPRIGRIDDILRDRCDPKDYQLWNTIIRRHKLIMTAINFFKIFKKY